jgi:hypothetical protein
LVLAHLRGPRCDFIRNLSAASETCQLLTTNSDGPYQATGTPHSWDHKYIAEDVPVGLTPMHALGLAAGLQTPAIDAVITIAKTLAGADFEASART